MTPLLINHSESTLLHSECINDCTLEIREYENYRWFTLGGDVVQSLMDKEKPKQVLMPVCQSMLLFTLWKKTPATILNLGMGAASFERFFHGDSMGKITSVESCPQVISMAKKYFDLPNQSKVHCQSAENYLQNNTSLFDVVLCDIFSEQQNVACVSQDWFYDKLRRSISVNGLVSMNLDPIDEQNVLNILQLAGRYFSNIVIMEFKDYKNIVLLLSQIKIPKQKVLLDRNQTSENSTGIDFTEFVLSMHYLPNKA